MLYSFFSFAPDPNFAIDVTFGTSSGYSLILAKGFSDVSFIIIDIRHML